VFLYTACYAQKLTRLLSGRPDVVVYRPAGLFRAAKSISGQFSFTQGLDGAVLTD
jgi:hypothetical protein